MLQVSKNYLPPQNNNKKSRESARYFSYDFKNGVRVILTRFKIHASLTGQFSEHFWQIRTFISRRVVDFATGVLYKEGFPRKLEKRPDLHTE